MLRKWDSAPLLEYSPYCARGAPLFCINVCVFWRLKITKTANRNHIISLTPEREGTMGILLH